MYLLLCDWNCIITHHIPTSMKIHANDLYPDSSLCTHMSCGNRKYFLKDCSAYARFTIIDGNSCQVFVIMSNRLQVVVYFVFYMFMKLYAQSTHFHVWPIFCLPGLKQYEVL